MSDGGDRLTREERRKMYGPYYELAVAAHKFFGHSGLFKDCCEKVCIVAIGALDTLDISDDL